MDIHLPLSIIIVFFPAAHSLFDKPISVSCRTNFDPSNWTHHAFIIQTLVMVLLLCFCFYYLNKRYGWRCRSRNHTSHPSLIPSNTRDISPPYGQVPTPPVTQPMAFYTMLPPIVPPPNHVHSLPSATPHNIVQ